MSGGEYKACVCKWMVKVVGRACHSRACTNPLNALLRTWPLAQPGESQRLLEPHTGKQRGEDGGRGAGVVTERLPRGQ